MVRICCHFTQASAKNNRTGMSQSLRCSDLNSSNGTHILYILLDINYLYDTEARVTDYVSRKKLEDFH